MSDRYIGDGECGAVLDDERIYRYSLWRRWHADCYPSEMCAFVGLNPSTADETEDDPTIRRCIGFAKAWGFGGLVMLNIFALRSTDPKGLRAVSDPVGPLNDEALNRVSGVVGRTVCCWGTHGKLRDRGSLVRWHLKHAAKRSLFHLGLSKGGFPKHPLYLKANTEPVRW